MLYTNSKKIAAFRRIVWAYWRKHGRHDLPWRKTTDPYKILVSEMMLQQTQVPRVIGKYKSFLKKFPTVRVLAKAGLGDVLREWNGLGYNRRAKYLHDAAKLIAKNRTFDQPLPGVGQYTKAAVNVFAFNKPDILIETNVRTAFIHHFGISLPFHHGEKVRILDSEIYPLACEVAKGQDPRKWHWALMDYGAHLKRSGVHNNARSAHYTKQSKFEGSIRQVRGAILRALHHDSKSENKICSLIRTNKRIVDKALKSLARDGLIVKKGKSWHVS